MTIEEEILQLKSISNIGLALIDFTKSLYPGHFTRIPTDWVFKPNFVAFAIHSKKKNSITLSLRGSPPEFNGSHTSLLIYSGSGRSYSRCIIERPDQLDAAAYYIRRALAIYHLGRNRSRKITPNKDQE